MATLDTLELSAESSSFDLVTTTATYPDIRIALRIQYLDCNTYSLSTFFSKNAGYGAMMVTRPQTVGYGLSDSPAGLAAWMYDKFAQWTYSGGEPERSLSKNQMLDDITLYWLTNSAVSSARLYWENNNNNFGATAQKTADISLPVAVTVFPGEIYRAPRTWTEQAYHHLIYFNEVDNGGHFAAWEEPELFAKELRAAFRSLR